MRWLLLCVLVIGSSAAPAAGWWGRVVAVQTGDTLTVTHGARRVRVRLAGIDAPPKRTAGWLDARNSLSDLCQGRRARVSPTTPGRAAVVCRVAGMGYYSDAAVYQVGEGWARVPADGAAFALLAAQLRAQSACRGLWVDCPILDTGGSGGSLAASGIPGPSDLIAYSVEGTAASAALTIATPGGGTSQFSTLLPYSGPGQRFGGSDFLYLSAQNNTAAGSVAVAILFHGRVLRAAESSEPYGIASTYCLRGFDC